MFAPLPASVTPSLLQLVWLASPALPIGGFSYSEGLEAAVECAGTTTEKRTEEWLLDQLHLSLARSDLAVVTAAVAALRVGDTARLAALNLWVLSTRESSELRLQTEQMGKSLLDWLRNLDPQRAAVLHDLAPPTYPLAFSAAAAATDAAVVDIGAVYAFGWAENMVQTALKAVPLGQSAGQRILARLAAEIPTAVATAMALPDTMRQAFTPRLAILSAQHEIQYSRLFRS